MMEVSDNLDIFCCPDCLREFSAKISLVKKSKKVYCPVCKRIFFHINSFIDLLPRKPNLLENGVNKNVKDYYYRQFSIPPDFVFKNPSVWGQLGKFSRGYKVFLEEEISFFERNFSSSRNIFCDISSSQGLFLEKVSKSFKIVVICDINLEHIQYLINLSKEKRLENVVFVRLDYLDFPFSDNVLDTCVCTDSFIYYGLDLDVNVISMVYQSLTSKGVFLFDLHNRKFYFPSREIFEYTKRDVDFLRYFLKGLEVYPFGRVPTFIHPYRFLFNFFSRFVFLPPLRYICKLVKGKVDIIV